MARYSGMRQLLVSGVFVFAGAAAPALAADDALVMAIQGTPAAIDGEQALTSEGEMMMANVHGGDLFGYKVVKGSGGAPDSVDLKSTGDQGVVGLLAQSWQAN